ncbi:hypothetical protein sphantq_04751 (plasmid) [Sphingobium sp. AntQ-1]|uniref:NADPH-dependent FMN reductase n=1 Tax=Sphingobium sp. AntQ-1 TaxID=2930091 RepID=UPI00234F0ED8|nr:NAD(P)H-dependent oxidoreductase [Sphingobium sp. AntQ-1]WCP16255.1 hypothetical protein sphantq_04751 [Sphingobium sp. AntQ-1]
MAGSKPYIVGVGGTASPTSSTEQALRFALGQAEKLGARTRLFGGGELMDLPHYLHSDCRDHAGALELVQELRAADGVIIASPGYHGNISGLVKNALDYTEEMARDERPYFDGLAVGIIATAYGWQAACNTLSALRSITHALRGWPTPLGVAINTATPVFRDDDCIDADIQKQMQVMVDQVVRFGVGRGAVVT